MRVSNLHLLVAMAGMAIGVCGSVFLLHLTLSLALLISFGLGVAFGLLAFGLVPSNPELDKYRADTKLRAKRVLRTVAEIRRQTTQVGDDEMRAALLEACDVFPRMLECAPRNEQATTAARLQIQLTHINSALGIYLQIQAEPHLYNDGEITGDQLLLNGRRELIAVRGKANAGMQQLNSGKVREFKLSLEMLAPAPTEIPDIT